LQVENIKMLALIDKKPSVLACLATQVNVMMKLSKGRDYYALLVVGIQNNQQKVSGDQ